MSGKGHPILTVIVILAAVGLLLGLVMTLFFAVAGPSEAFSFKEKIAVLPLEGAITESDSLVAQLVEFRKDRRIKAIILRVNSPGGGVGPSQEIYREIRKTIDVKKVVASMGSVAASGGYYVASAADKIVANPGTLAGSIGVIMEFVQAEELLEKIGVKGMVVKAGEFKDIGSPYRDMTAQEKKLLQDVIDDVHNQFIKAVAEGRNLPEADVRAIADGRIFTGQQALALKLVDQMGDLADSIRLAGSLAGIKGKPKVVEKKKKIPFFEYLKEESATWVADVIQNGIGKSSVNLQYLYR